MRRLLTLGGDDGRISLLIAGFLGILGLLILGAVDVTAVQLARMRMLDTSDSAASDAADAIHEGGVYGRGVGEDLRVTSGSVRSVAQSNLDRHRLPKNVGGWRLASGTGSADGRTAVVVLTGTVHPPISGGFLGFGHVSVTVRSHARADIQD